MEMTSKTVKDVLETGTDHLAAKNIEHPRLICELLASRLLKCKRLELYLKFDTVLSDKLIEAMIRGVKRVGEGEPVQYVTGQAEFMGYIFKTDKRALIPRPETEILVNQVLECKPLWQNDKPAIVDVGTGSGCIVISLALARPEALYIGLDISEDAVALANENAAALGAAGKIAFACNELPDAVEPGTISAIVSNPPYIPTATYEKLPVNILNHEPRLSLDGGPNGLMVIETIVQDAAIALKPGGFLFLEIGDTQANAVKSLLAGAGFHEIMVFKDLAGRDRVVCGTLV
ncbi:MAG: peptide chain release factor N(5)-glutamine methyltransferase [Kiritimatiellae bacterium]|nr:peptide chain release factor N(5)-glutamine methyltransferase [Kiritimatiellia bacterium]MDD5519639.1 peptide chain release factor N(5)-glutamine methyltransferase [Kiritimatiellia bacterium]